MLRFYCIIDILIYLYIIFANDIIAVVYLDCKLDIILLTLYKCCTFRFVFGGYF